MCDQTLRERTEQAGEVATWRHNPHELGVRGEKRAMERLLARNWTIMGTNWQSGFGEVDIIAVDPEAPASTVTLVEVKTRMANGDDDLMPELAVDEQKRERYRNAAMRFMQLNEWVEHVRFDVIAITVAPDGSARLRHLKGAYGGDR